MTIGGDMVTKAGGIYSMAETLEADAEAVFERAVSYVTTSGLALATPTACFG
jgi:hypothetical protein